jgi:hypothetical protein
MKKYLILITILLTATICFAEQKTYTFGEKTVVDISGVKPLEAIAAEFGGTAQDWVDVTPLPPTAEEIAAKEAEQKAAAEKQALIQAKMEEIAKAELVAEGKLDENGDIIKVTPLEEVVIP